MQNCKNCKYFDVYENQTHGGCHRYPPQNEPHTLIWMINELYKDSGVVDGELIEVSSVWWGFPIVEDSDYCGEFKEASDHDILP